MKKSQLLIATLASAAAVAGLFVSPRPRLEPMPYEPTVPFPKAGPRDGRLCVVETRGDGVTDDSDAIMAALRECNYGGHVLFPRGRNYTIGTAMDWTFLRHIDVDIQGSIKFTSNTTYWQANSYRFVFQNATSFFKLGGDDVWFYGGGTLDGNGQVWYDLYAADIYILRPVLFGIDGLNNSVFSDLNLRYSPQYYHFVANSTNVVWNNISIAGYSTSNNTAKNTDGWDTYRSTDLTIQNSVIQNGDDCVSFKPNSTNMLVQSLSCTGSHGISVGSLGQYVGEYDIVEHVMVSNISMHNTSDGARIKVWPNAPSEMSGDLQGGGGDGRVLNITYENFTIDNVAYAIEITQCYGQTNLTLCTEYPSPLTIEDIVFRNFAGVTSTQYMPLVAAFACSSEAVCGNITATEINVHSPNGTELAFCLNQDTNNLDVQCTNTYLGFN